MSIGTEGAAVLLVEDDPLLRRAISRASQEVYAEMTAVGTGQEALEAVGPETACDFSSVIVDIGLPDVDRCDVCAAVRARGITTPVLFLTARGQVDDRLSRFTAGGNDHLPEPFDTRELLVRTGALVRRAGSTPPREVTGSAWTRSTCACWLPRVVGPVPDPHAVPGAGAADERPRAGAAPHGADGARVVCRVCWPNSWPPSTCCPAGWRCWAWALPNTSANSSAWACPSRG